jgi:hypothetical protein
MNDVNFSAITHLAAVMPGYPFRGSIQPEDPGEALVVQMKDIAPEGAVHWSGAIRSGLKGRKTPDWLCAGDVLVLARGTRFLAVCLDEPPALAVCAPVFFHLRVQRAELDPAFLAWQINQPPCQRQLAQGAAGSLQQSITRPVLESLRVAVPPIARQRAVVGFVAAARRERQAMEQLIRNLERQEQFLAEDLHRAAEAASDSNDEHDRI